MVHESYWHWTSDGILYQCVPRVAVYTVFQEELPMFWEIIVSVILNKKVYMYMCVIPNDFRGFGISFCSTQYALQTSNTLRPHTKCRVH
jgi:hypothetical protein